MTLQQVSFPHCTSRSSVSRLSPDGFVEPSTISDLSRQARLSVQHRSFKAVYRGQNGEGRGEWYDSSCPDSPVTRSRALYKAAGDVQKWSISLRVLCLICRLADLESQQTCTGEIFECISCRFPQEEDVREGSLNECFLGDYMLFAPVVGPWLKR